MDSFWNDARYAIRSLLKRPGFLAVAVVTLALGAGANAAIFSVVNTVLLQPLPYPGSDRIVRVIQNRTGAAVPGGLPNRLSALSTDHLYEIRLRSQTLAHIAAYGPAPLTMTGRDEPVRLAAQRVSPGMFHVLGVAPMKGRTFDPGEDKAGADAVVVLSFPAWQKYFAADPDILTRTLTLDGRGYTVVGVMPRGFEFPDSQTEAWVPFVLSAPVRTPGQRMIQIVQVVARVKDNVSIPAATSEVNAIFKALQDEESRRDAEDMAAMPDDMPAAFRRGGPALAGGPQMFRRGGPPPGGPQAFRRGGPPDEIRRGGPPEEMRRGGPGGRPEGGPRGGRMFGMGQQQATIELSPMKEELVRPVRPALVVMLAAVGFVLLIACANVANLLLARAAGRRQEFAVRAALGAARGRIVRQVLTESLVLAVLGSALGSLLAYGAIRALRVLGPADIPRLDHLGLDLPFFGFTLGVSVLTGILFGIMPALRLSRTSEMQAIKQGASFGASGLRMFGGHRVRSVLAMAEIALALMLLVGAGLLINSFLKLSNVSPGYDPTNVLSFQLMFPQGRYQAPQRETFSTQLLERLKSLPGARAVAVSNTLPLQQGITRLSVRLEGQPEPTRMEDATIADVRVASPGYLTTMGIALVSGRTFLPESRAEPPKELLVNRSFATRYLPNTQAVGARVNMDGPEPWTIVGVVGDVRHAGLTAEPVPEIYVDYRQAALVMPRLQTAFFTIRTATDPLPLLSNIRGLVRQLDAQLVVDNIATMDQRLSTSIARPRFYATLIGVFAFIAVALAAVGIYGVLAYTVSQSTREIGIRLALGAPRAGVLGLVLAQGCVIAGAGIAIGLAGAALVTRSLATLLFGLTPFDPLTFAGVSALLGVIAIAACYIPARRAMQVDPIVALRQD
jgi:predicted permease